MATKLLTTQVDLSLKEGGNIKKKNVRQHLIQVHEPLATQ